MAGGKQSPRQKMINLMYLVFIAMLALNISKEVLNAFGEVNNSLEENNMQTTQRNSALMASLSEKASEQPEKYGPLKDKAAQVSAMGQELVNYIEKIKIDLLSNLKKNDEGEYEYREMDKSDFLDNKFFKNDKVSPEGQKLVDRINAYREGVKSVVTDPAVKAEVNKKFDTSPIKGTDGGTQPWLRKNYEGFPMIASLTKLTQIQSNIKNTESEILSSMMQGQLISEVSMSKYQAIVVPDKTAFFNGENFTGTVVLGRFDNTLSFDKIIVNGKEIESTQAGQVALDFPAGNVGEQDIKGELQFKEGDSIVKIAIETSYTVIPKPNAAVISADKMNVVYRGVQNPMTISVPGASDVSASAPGLRQASGAGKYMMDVTNVKAYEVNIKVNAKLPGGSPFSDSKTFRIKEIPRPSGTVRGQMMEGGPIQMQRAGLAKSTVSATIPNFDFELNLSISGFSIRVEGERTIVVNGQQLNQAAKNVLQSAKRGASVQIFDIKASISGNSGYKLPYVSPIFIELKD